jgi:hypothetical protein
MDKKIFSIIFLALLLVSTISFVLAQNPLDEFAGKIDEGTKKIEETEQKVQNLTREDAKWEYLGEWWQGFLLKNKAIAFMDNLFTKGNIVFVVLFGRDYALSLTLLFLIFLWVYFLSQFDKILSTFSTFGSGTSFVIALGMTIILAQMKFFDWFSEVLFKLVFYQEGVYGWIWVVGSIIFAILVGMILSRFFSSLKRAILKWKDESYRKKLIGDLEQKNKVFGIIVDALSGMFSKS